MDLLDRLIDLLEESTEHYIGFIHGVLNDLPEIVLATGNFILSGLVLDILWRWFISFRFHLPELGIAEALGVILTFQALRVVRSRDSQPRFRNWAAGQEAGASAGSTSVNPLDLLMSYVAPPLAILLVGYIIHNWFLG